MKAFPSIDPVYKNHVVEMKVSFGMDLRDYFAAKAMQAILSRVDTDLTFDADILAINSYKVADSMMKEREE
jgi:hypothetical protein